MLKTMTLNQSCNFNVISPFKIETKSNHNSTLMEDFKSPLIHPCGKLVEKYDVETMVGNQRYFTFQNQNIIQQWLNHNH